MATILPERVTSPILAELFGISDRRVRQLADEGVISGNKTGRATYYELIPTVQAYVAHLKASQRADIDEDAEKRKMKADADYKRWRADQEELKLAELRGQMHRSEDVEAATNQLVYTMRGAMIALPGRIAMDAQYKSASEVSAIAEAAVNEALRGLMEFEYDPAAYAELVREREKWIADSEEYG